MNNTTFLHNTGETNAGDSKQHVGNMELSMKPYLLLTIFIQALLSTVGNLIIFLMTITMPTLRKKTSVYFILCLSFSDLLFGSASIDHYFQSNLDVIPLWRCLFTTIVSLSALLISLAQTFLICLERTLQLICFPDTSLLLTDKYRTFTIVVTWVVCAGYICALVIASSLDCPLEDNTVEDFLTSCKSAVNGFTVLFSPAYIGVIVQYIFLLYKVRKLQQSVRNLRFNPENQSEAANENSSLNLFKDIFKTLSIFVIMYLVSFCPLAINLTKIIFSGNADGKMFAVVVILVSLNGLFSPLLYIYRFKEVRSLFEC